MDPIRNILPGRWSELQSHVKQPPGRLTAEDIGRLRAKREEITEVLQRWHGYSRVQADKVLSHWLHSHS